MNKVKRNDKYWAQKTSALLRIFGATTGPGFILAVDPKESNPENVFDAWRKWNKSMPRSYQWFLILVSEKLSELKCDKRLNPEVILQSTYHEFYNYLHTDLKLRVERPLELSAQEADKLSGIGNIYFALGNHIEPISTGILNGQIDQKHYYLNQDATEHWLDMIDCVDYPTYNECLRGLEELTTSHLWKEFIGSETNISIAMLGGGGAPQKDITLIKSINTYAKNTPLPYCLIDTSVHMIEHSAHWLNEKSKRNRNLLENIRLRLIKGDIMNMSLTQNFLRPQNNRTCWFLTGQTFGNIEEDIFFKSIYKESETDDLLIIGVECVDETLPKDELSKLVTQYEKPRIINFVSTTLPSLCSLLNIGKTIDEVRHMVQPRLLEGKDNISKISNTYSIEFYINVEDTIVSLIKSTRYEETALIKYAQEYSFEHMGTILSPLNKNYRHIVLSKREN
jgi:hypothetical protein